jgi:hypothetical protein
MNLCTFYTKFLSIFLKTIIFTVYHLAIDTDDIYLHLINKMSAQ